MKLIVGLGNPGEEYKNTRHNVGFMFVEYLASQWKTNDGFKFDKYLQSEWVEIQNGPEKIILAKPQTFMNKSGEAVNQLAIRYKLSANNLIVAHDDLDIPFGKFHIQVGRGPLLHNGLESIENHIKTKDFIRVRIGVDARTPERKVDGETYVLEKFTEAEGIQFQKEICTTLFTQLRERRIVF